MRLGEKAKRLIRKMEERGHSFDDWESRRGWLRFFGEYGAVSFATWKEVEAWLKETEDLYETED